jgi:hypothetical protein
MDLLTRGAGFGYIGSTITSLIYASFTFIFFALEAAIMAYALELAFDIPPAWGYLICALVVIPLVTHGVTAISRLQVWTQPLWLALLVCPSSTCFRRPPDAAVGAGAYAGEGRPRAAFDLLLFGAALTVGIALITQMGEQADYLRFMPERRRPTAAAGGLGVLLGGPGWVVLGVLKMLGGALLAYLALGTWCRPTARSTPTRCTWRPTRRVLRTTAGRWRPRRCSWSSRSSRSTSPTPTPAAGLEQLLLAPDAQPPGPRGVDGVQHADRADADGDERVPGHRRQVLGLYSNIAIAWMMAVVADLVVNKPLGWSRRASSSSARTCTTSTRWAWARWAGLGAVDRRAPGRLRAAGAGLLGADRAGGGLRRLAADRLGHEGPLLPGAGRLPEPAAAATAGAPPRRRRGRPTWAAPHCCAAA